MAEKTKVHDLYILYRIKRGYNVCMDGSFGSVYVPRNLFRTKKGGEGSVFTGSRVAAVLVE